MFLFKLITTKSFKPNIKLCTNQILPLIYVPLQVCVHHLGRHVIPAKNQTNTSPVILQNSTVPLVAISKSVRAFNRIDHECLLKNNFIKLMHTCIYYGRKPVDPIP